MTPESLIIALGAIAGLCTTVAYVPQAVRTWKQGGNDLSYGMLILYLTGVFLWLIYGVLVHAQAVVYTNVVTAVLIAIITGLKVYRGKTPHPRQAIRREAVSRT